MQTAKRISLTHYILAGEIEEHIRNCCCGKSAEASSIAKLTQRFAICETTLKNAFKQRYKINIHAFLMQERIKQICVLLDETNYSIKTIAIMTGYEELGEFLTRFFEANENAAKFLQATKFAFEKHRGTNRISLKSML